MRRAKNPAERGFDRYDKRRLTKALQGIEEVRTYRRVQAVLLVAHGRTVTAAAEIVEGQPWAVYAWVRAYLQRHDPGCPQDAPRSGRPRAAPALTNKRIAQEVRRDPMRLGYSATGWTVALLAEHLQRKYDGNRPAEYITVGNSAPQLFVRQETLPQVRGGVPYGREGFQFRGSNSAMRLPAPSPQCYLL